MLSRKDWDTILVELVRVTKPGGWIELFEFDYDLQRPGPNGERLHKAGEHPAFSGRRVSSGQFNLQLNTSTIVKNNCMVRGAEVTGSDRLERFTRTYRFEHVQSDFIMSPLGWNGPNGEIASQVWRTMMMRMKAKLVIEMNVEGDAYDQLVKKAVTEFVEHKTWAKYPYLYAMKPVA